MASKYSKINFYGLLLFVLNQKLRNAQKDHNEKVCTPKKYYLLLSTNYDTNNMIISQDSYA